MYAVPPAEDEPPPPEPPFLRLSGMGVAIIAANCNAAVAPAAMARTGPAKGVASAAITAAAPPIIALAIAIAF